MYFNFLSNLMLDCKYLIIPKNLKTWVWEILISNSMKKNIEGNTEKHVEIFGRLFKFYMLCLLQQEQAQLMY